MGLGRLAEEQFEAVIFDMDGTLINSIPSVERSWRVWAGEYDLTQEQIDGYHGVPAAEIVRQLIPEANRDRAYARINEIELADLDDIVVLPGAAEALAALKQSKNAIATSCTTALAAVRIAAAGLTAPSVIVTVDDVARGKPYPDPFLLAARRLDVDPRRCLVVEDAPSGLQAARAAGCSTLAVLVTTPRSALSADAIVEDLADVEFSVTAEGISLRPAQPPIGRPD